MSFPARVLLGFALIAPLAAQRDAAQLDSKQQAQLKLAREVYKDIVTNTNYGVFDDIHFGLKGDTVILRGQASRPILKSTIENTVKKIEGISKIENEIAVLPLSPNDDRIRAQVYASLYSFPTLQKYTSNRAGFTGMTVARRAGGITNDPPIGYHAIHIIVQNGNVRLVGVVDNEADSNVAEIRANTVSGVFSVDNDIQVAKPPQK
ncbi:MAG TPA: BON domain-containing protein [Bryobacteraceae bacterium]|nr:BON domain-containing protein [Bryobacteraceae bacterium]